MKMLQELEEHIEGEKRNKRHKNLIEMRRGMLHSQLINEQMKGAQELREDTAQKMKTIELTEEERQQRKELRYEIWETKVGKTRRITETIEEMGWGKRKLKSKITFVRVDFQHVHGEHIQIKEGRQNKGYTEGKTSRVLAGSTREIKKGNDHR